MVLNRRLFFILTLLLALTPRAGASEALQADCVRLHVVAADDSAEAQALKLEVRDACLACAGALLADCADADEAWRIVNENLEQLTQAARDASGDVPARAETGIYDFPDRVYGETLVPAGRYRALRVVLGPGEGHNWWCVLYPSLCMPEDYQPDAPVQFHSIILDWIRAWFGGRADEE